jgi:hypothetical protein
MSSSTRSDRPLHFDLMRVDEKQTIKIEIAVHFINRTRAKPSVRAVRWKSSVTRSSEGPRGSHPED